MLRHRGCQRAVSYSFCLSILFSLSYDSQKEEFQKFGKESKIRENFEKPVFGCHKIWRPIYGREKDG